ncbi:MAG: flagellar protein FliS [Clostridia bacterium]|nr:flagellar protein FliS [Clostridia bacterium]
MTKEEINSFSYRISQASRTDLVVIMLDMAKQYVKDAESAYDGGNDDEFCSYTKQAKRVVDALSTSLDMRYPISAELFNIYAYAAKTLNKAMLKKDKKDFDVLCRVFDKLCAAFKEVAKEDTSGALMANAQKVYAGLTYSNGRLDEIAYDLSGKNRGFTV